jgi:hypothetical protein
VAKVQKIKKQGLLFVFLIFAQKSPYLFVFESDYPKENYAYLHANMAGVAFGGWF